MQFDTSLDLTTEQAPAYVPPREAVARVRQAVERLPGAFWISVEWCGQLPAVEQPVEWVRVYRRGESGVMQGLPWDAIKADIKAAVAACTSHRRKRSSMRLQCVSDHHARQHCRA